MRIIGTRLAGLAAVALAGFGGLAHAADCDRACLEGFVDRYLDAVVADNPSAVPLAPGVRFTEDGQQLVIGDGLWNTMRAKGKYRLFVTDVPAGQVAFFGSIAMIWLRPAGVTAAPVWLNVALQVATYAATAAFWGRWQAQTHFARLPDGSLDSTYLRTMSTHWIRAAIITLNGLVVFWMVVQHLSIRVQRAY